MQSGQDQALAGRFKRAGIKPVSPGELVEAAASPPKTTRPSHNVSVQDAAADSCASGRQIEIGPTSPLSLPSYIYRWHTYPGVRHLSALGKDG